MKSKTKKNQKRTYLIIAAVVTAVIIAGLLIGFYVMARMTPAADNKADTSTDTTTTEQEGSVDKPDKSDDTQTDGVPVTSTEPTNATMVIVDASQYGSTFEVRSYVNTLEQGTCAYTFTLGSQKVTKQSETLINGDSTSCSTLTVDTSEFASSGSWQLTIDYLAASGNVSGQIKKAVDIKV